MSPREHPSSQIELPPTLSPPTAIELRPPQRGRPFLGSPRTWALHGGSVCVCVEAPHSISFVKSQICCLPRASGVSVVASGPTMVSVVLRSVRSWLFCNSCVCWSHVSAWLTSVKVFPAVPLGVSCFLSCWVGGYFVARQNVGAQGGSSRHSDADGRRVMRVRLVFWRSGASGMGANAVGKESTIWVFSKKACTAVSRREGR